MLVPATINSLGEAELARIAREELGEDEEVMEAAVAEIRGWIASCPHLASTRRDDLFLRVFYRGCDYNMETVRAKYDLFYTARSRAGNEPSRSLEFQDHGEGPCSTRTFAWLKAAFFVIVKLQTLRRFVSSSSEVAAAGLVQ